MVAGALAVGALVVWALTRTVEPAAPVAVTDATAVTEASTVAPLSTETTSPITNTAISQPVGATTPPPAPAAGDPSSVQRIAVEDLRAKMNRNEVTVIDVRDARAYAMQRIPSSLNIPLASVEAMLDQIPKDKPIVTYCKCPAEESSAAAALILQEKGFTNVTTLYGGISAWTNLGYPTEGSQRF